MQVVQTLAEAIACLLKRGHRLAAEHTPTDTPILHGRRLPKGSGQQFDFELPVARYDKTVKLTFNVDRFGEWEGDEFSLWFGPGHIECGVVVSVPSAKGEIRFGVVLIGDGTPLNQLPGFASWEEFANLAVPILYTFPEVGVPILPSRTAALTAFVFRAVYGTEYADESPPFCMVEDLWMATLFALSSLKLKPSDTIHPQSDATPAAQSPARPKPRRKRGNPGISDSEAKLRWEILAKLEQYRLQKDAAHDLFDHYRGRVIAEAKSGTPMKTPEDFSKYISDCKSWASKQPLAKRPEKTARKKSRRPRKNSSE